MHYLTKIINGLTICFLVSVNCYAKDEPSNANNVIEFKWYEAKNIYNKIIRESREAKRNDSDCDKKLDSCDKHMKSSLYYPKALADANARLDAAESKLYEKMSLEFNADNIGVQKD